MRKTWRLSGGADTLVIIHRSDIKKDEDPVKPVFLRSCLDRWLADPLSRKTILDIYQSIGGAIITGADKLSPQRIHRYIKPHLEAAFLRGDFVAVRPPRSPSIAGQKEVQDLKPPSASVEKKQEKEKTWIKLRVIEDKSNRPIMGLKLTITAPNGAVVNSVTNSDGTIEIKDINDGVCTVTSPVKMTRLNKTFNFEGIGEKQATPTSTGAERHPESAINGDSMAIALIKRHKVKTGETLDSLAKTNDLTWQELSEFNWGTSVSEEINRCLYEYVGCTNKTTDGKNYMFDSNDDPGIIYIPNNWKQSSLVTDKTYTLRVTLCAYPEFQVLYFIDQQYYILPNAPYTILDVEGNVMESGTSDKNAHIKLPSNYQKEWRVVAGSVHSIKGTIFLPDLRKPLADQPIEVTFWTKKTVNTRTDNDGRISLEKVPQGSLAIRWQGHQAVYCVDRDNDNASFILKSAEGKGEEIDTPDDHDCLNKLRLTPEVTERYVILNPVDVELDPFRQYPLHKSVEIAISYEIRAGDSTLSSGSFKFVRNQNEFHKINLSEEWYQTMTKIVIWAEPYGYAALLSPGEKEIMAKGRLEYSLNSNKDDNEIIFKFEVLKSVIQFIVDEMNWNKKHKDVIDYALWNERANIPFLGSYFKNMTNEAFARKVHTNEGVKGFAADIRFLGGGEWYHKGIIGDIWGEHNRFGNSGKSYFYDIYSNMHYGYVGHAAGFTIDELKSGANIQQMFDHGEKDDTSDVDAIVEGFNMYEEDKNVTVEEVLKIIERHDEWQTKERYVVWELIKKKKREERERIMRDIKYSGRYPKL